MNNKKKWHSHLTHETQHTFQCVIMARKKYKETIDRINKNSQTLNVLVFKLIRKKNCLAYWIPTWRWRTVFCCYGWSQPFRNGKWSTIYQRGFPAGHLRLHFIFHWRNARISNRCCCFFGLYVSFRFFLLLWFQWNASQCKYPCIWTVTKSTVYPLLCQFPWQNNSQPCG